MTHDPEALFAARYAIRDACTRIRRLRQTDPVVRDMVVRLDRMCGELSEELDMIEPGLCLRMPVLTGGVG